MYHDKLLVEEAMRKANFEKAQIAHKIRNEKEEKREKTEKQLQYLKTLLKK